MTLVFVIVSSENETNRGWSHFRNTNQLSVFHGLFLTPATHVLHPRQRLLTKKNTLCL